MEQHTYERFQVLSKKIYNNIASKFPFLYTSYEYADFAQDFIEAVIRYNLDIDDKSKYNYIYTTGVNLLKTKAKKITNERFLAIQEQLVIVPLMSDDELEMLRGENRAQYYEALHAKHEEVPITLSKKAVEIFENMISSGKNMIKYNRKDHYYSIRSFFVYTSTWNRVMKNKKKIKVKKVGKDYFFVIGD